METYLKQLEQSTIVAVDTESTKNDALWSVQFSIVPGTAAFIHVSQKNVLAFLAKCLAKPDVLTILHNALHDLPMLAQADIFPAKPACSMVMAYLLQSEPQGLKPLAFRHAGMQMKSYKEMIRDASEEKAVTYLGNVVKHTWPAPDPVLEWKKEKPHVKQPQNIKKKAQRIIDDWADTAKDVDPRERWHNIGWDEGRGPVEDLLGVMPEAYLSDIPYDEATHYAGSDSDATLRIFPYLWEAIQSRGLEGTFWRDMNAMPMIVDMMQAGIKADPEYFKGLSKYFDTRMKEIERDITRETGQSLNVGSPDQVAKLLFDHLKIPKIKGRSTDASVLARAVSAHPVVQIIRDWRSYQKLKNTYSDQIPKKIQADGRVHTTFRITRTATGRLSSANPNLQAQPVKGEEGPKIREGFVAADGCYIVSNDYSQIEMRVTAHDSQDPTMIQIFRDDKDIHTITAASVWGIPEQDIDEMKHRYPVKRVGFGILYDITAYGLHRTFQQEGITQWSQDDCQRIIDEWFKVYPGVKEYMKQIKLHARRYGYVRDFLGRIRYIPGARAANKYVQAEALRMAGNAPIQMGAQGIIKQAMGNLVPVYKDFRTVGTLNPLIQIHDDLVSEMAKMFLGTVNPVIRKVMEEAITLRVPVKVDTKYGETWGIMKKWEKKNI